MAKKTSRPGRTLLIFLLTTGVLYGLAALGGTWKPRLGLDLEGGTRIQLIAEGSPTAEKLKQAASIIDSRVNGSGVSEAEVSTQGSTNVVVEIPGKNSQNLVDAVKRTAQMRFRLEADCPQITGGPCTAPGTMAPASSSTSPSPSATTTTATPTVKPTPTTASSATPKPRPAPAYAVKAATPKPTPTNTAKATATATPQTAPKAPAKADPGAPITDQLKWVKDPGTEWQLRFAAAKCDSSNQALVPVDAKHLNKLAPAQDIASQPMISCDEQGNKSLLSTAVIEGNELKSASYGQSQGTAGWEVYLGFKSKAADEFGKISTAMAPSGTGPNVGGRFATVLDGKVLQILGFSSQILDGNARVTGNFTQAEAKALSNSLKYGALPVKFKKDVSTQVIGPSLAGNQLSAGILAGIIGLLIVMLYCLLYYRGLGLVVIASLLIAGAVTYAMVLLLAKGAGFTLTLPGIAGLIVAVGITADSFIVYFERIRDEMREGKSMRVAVETGWKRARNTCLAADTVSFLAAVVLYIFAIGVVRGFAFALGISTLIDVAVFFWFTKPMMTLLARRKFFNSGHRFSGLSPETLGMDEDPKLVGSRI